MSRLQLLSFPKSLMLEVLDLGWRAFTYDDATLSGTPVLARFADGGRYLYSKFYPEISAMLNPTQDPVLDGLCTLENANLSDDPTAVMIRTKNLPYYLMTYPTPDSQNYSVNGRTLICTGYLNPTLSGTPRILKIMVNSTAYYAKVYPSIQ